MAFPAMRDPNRVPLNVLFPEAYESSKREIARDFLAFGTIIVFGVVFAAMMNLASTP